jgi:hypothetical protein
MILGFLFTTINILVIHQGVTISRHGQIWASNARFVVWKAEIVVSFMLYLLNFCFGYNSIYIEFTYGRSTLMIVFSQFWSSWMFSGRQALQKNRGHMFAPKIGRSSLTGQTCGSHRSGRCGQCPQNTIWTLPMDKSCWVDQDSYVERPNWSPDEGDMTSPRFTRRVHRSGRCPWPVWPVHPESEPNWRVLIY